jgi:hypothetical protein
VKPNLKSMSKLTKLLRTLSDLIYLHLTSCSNRLNLFNPMKPEGSHVLSIGRFWEEKQIAKILCGLEVHEPGENWISFSFKWDLEAEYFPGWVLTQPWLSADGMANRGILSVRYYSGEGKGYYGCQVYIYIYIYIYILTYIY